MTPLLLALLTSTAQAADVWEGERLDVDLGGDVKTFTLATFPYDHVLMPEDPYGQGVADGRAKLDIRAFGVLRLTAHHAITVWAPNSTAGTGLTQSGVGLSAPEAVDLTWEATDEDNEDLRVRGRTDRLVLSASLPHVDLSLGRQPVTFGKALMFTPMDLVTTFSPGVIDSEYKPGVDAARVDVYWGMAGQATVVAAYAGDWDPEGMIYAAYAQGTVGVWDIGGFAGYVREDWVFGATTAGSIFALGVRAEATVTLPPGEDEDPFVRAVVGADWLPHERVSLSAELYVQSIGAAEPSGYLDLYATERFARGELWAAGRWYLGLAGSFEIAPTLHASVAVIDNLADPSAMVAPGLAWSISDDAELGAGLYFGMGRRPKDITLEDLLTDPDAISGAVQSEYGLIPTTGYLQLRAYF